MKKFLKLLLIAGLAVVAVIFISLMVIFPPFQKAELLAVSEPDTVAMKWEFYACGNDCPYYRVNSVEKEVNKQYQGRMADLRGYEWQAPGHGGENRDEAVYRAMFYDTLVCRGVFKQFSIPSHWECCLDGADNLAFYAESCEQVQTPLEKVFGRDLNSILLAAASGEAEALLDMYHLCSGGHWLPEDKMSALYWCALAAARGHEDGPYFLDRMRRDNETGPSAAAGEYE